MLLYNAIYGRLPEDKPPHHDVTIFSYNNHSLTSIFFGGTSWSFTTIQAWPTFTTISYYSANTAYQAKFQNR